MFLSLSQLKRPSVTSVLDAYAWPNVVQCCKAHTEIVQNSAKKPTESSWIKVKWAFISSMYHSIININKYYTVPFRLWIQHNQQKEEERKRDEIYDSRSIPTFDAVALLLKTCNDALFTVSAHLDKAAI